MKPFPAPGLLGLGLLAACSSEARYLSSPQFDGARFRNPTQPDEQGLLAVARHILFNRNGAWPERRIERRPILQVDVPTAPDEVAVTFVNHATVLIQTGGLNILTDPVWSEVVGPLSWAGPERAVAPGIPFEDLPPIDVVLISHNHYDHLDLPTLIRLSERDGPRFFVPLGDEALLRAAGIDQVVELDWWQRVDLDEETELIFTPARHASGRSPFDKNRSLWGGHLIKRGAHTIYFAGDTGFSDHFAEIRRRFGPIDLAFLPIGAYLPRETTRAFHLDPGEAVEAHQILEARHSIAIHFGTFQLTGEDFDQPVRDLSRALQTARSLPGPFRALVEGRTVRLHLQRRP
ncbi:MAG: MBL fold metallo-hydrolase [Myxococcales bacterium]|nr:MBL fold metallo-hydrolase [Myxococcales bacterium]MCB9647199.1 MBL fold metallo-hydrolase [Deltaproteobacteria bacterium]